MRGSLHLLTAVLFIGCSPAAPEESAPPAAQAARLREPDVHYEPTPQRIVHRMLALARVGPGDVVYDLGSGDGRIPIIAARDYGARGVGIDIDPERIAEAEANARAEGVAERVHFRNEDLLLADFREATVVTLFLSRDLNRRVKPRLLAELKPGTRVVSYYHAMPSWQPKRILRAGDDYIYLWIIPER
jgi:SAM-dependent methyltransferase